MHLARMVALMGPPPRDLLAESSDAGDFFNDRGEFKGTPNLTSKSLLTYTSGHLRPDIEVPDASLEGEDGVFSGKEKQEFLAFMRRMLQWRPADRSSAKELLEDPWLQSFGRTNQD